MRNALLKSVAFAALLFSVGSAGAQDLGPGSPAPALDVKAWYKGNPVTGFEPGKTYVVEFWATWCGPCKVSIPHLTKMAKSNPDVTFVGVSIWEPNDEAKIKQFIADMGEKMDYTVGWSSEREGMAISWMQAASQNGIPSAFIVKDRVIEWIGHPMEMDEPLAQVKAGTFNRTAFAEKFNKEVAEAKKSRQIESELAAISSAFTKGDKVKAKEDLARFETNYPERKSQASMMRFDWLSQEDEKAWQKSIEAMGKKKSPEDLQMLLSFALRQARPTGRVAQGEHALKVADKWTGGKDVNVLNYTFAFYDRLKKKTEALAVLDKIEKLLPDMSPDDKKQWEEAIKARRAALNRA